LSLMGRTTYPVSERLPLTPEFDADYGPGGPSTTQLTESNIQHLSTAMIKVTSQVLRTSSGPAGRVAHTSLGQVRFDSSNHIDQVYYLLSCDIFFYASIRHLVCVRTGGTT
jgi:hypothetical protein